MLGPEAVAVRAHNVTLCDLAQEGFFGLQLALTGESEDFVVGSRWSKSIM